MIHLYAPPGDWPETMCGRGHDWGDPFKCVYARDFDRVTCPDCLAKLQMQPVTAGDTARLRRGMFWSLWFAVPFWVVLAIALWQILT